MDAPAPLPPFLVREDHGAIAHLRLTRAGGRNTLSLAAMAALHAELDRVAADECIRVALLSGEGPAFCAGHDLKELTLRRSDADGGRAFFAQTFAQCSALMLAIAALPQPVVAVVEGVATAAGCQLVAACDLAVAGADATFCTPGVNIGLFCSTPMVPLTRAIAPKHAMEMLFTGEPVDAREALRFGLVNRVAPAGSAFAAAMELAGTIARKSRQTLATGKRAFHAQAHLPLAQAYEAASKAMVENMLDASAREGVAAFLEKRAPAWPA